MIVGIGQDYWSVSNYSAVFGLPDVVMSYTSLRNLSGLFEPINYGSGREYAGATYGDLGKPHTIQLGLWLVGDLEAVIAGALDARIEELASFCRQTRVYLRIGYECDNPENSYEPELFKTAYRRIAEKVDAETVFHAYGFGFERFWPGDDVVDWCGVSLFRQPFDSFGPAQAVADFCKGKNLMIAESTPFGIGLTAPRASILNTWFLPVLDFVEAYDVKLWCYINCDWDAQPMWQGQGWGDTRIETDPRLSAFWANHVLPHPSLNPRSHLWLYFFVFILLSLACFSSAR
ncbi:hypothetical protein CTAYLR_005162 [Chrysophaeum taylorii]|uniref:GH26 domain-containing protein n=1 Tax=Chrysophaeum taylorii TaxID=2483200 RepID=A0AAD7ULG5_9STRA|nr:hypothetical protein CTAYLR_005162 [Chrysophaeum taylorii]